MVGVVGVHRRGGVGAGKLKWELGVTRREERDGARRTNAVVVAARVVRWSLLAPPRSDVVLLLLFARE